MRRLLVRFRQEAQMFNGEMVELVDIFQNYDYLYIINHKKKNYLGRIVYFLKHPQNLFGRIISKLIEK